MEATILRFCAASHSPLYRVYSQQRLELLQARPFTYKSVAAESAPPGVCYNICMTNIIIRPIVGEELYDINLRLSGYAFRATPPLPDNERWREDLDALSAATHLALFEDDYAVSIAAASPMTQSVRSVVLPVGGVWAVATDPTARRKGYSKQVLQALFAHMRDAGMPLSVLYPFRESFYERLGYVVLPQPRTAIFPVAALGLLLRRDLGGSVTMLSLADGAAIWRAYQLRVQPLIHGMTLPDERAARLPFMRDRDWMAVARVGDEVVGIMFYRILGNGQNMLVSRFLTHTAVGRYLLLEWVARHIDQVHDVEIPLAPSDHPETWLPDLHVRLHGNENPMARIIDITKLNGLAVGSGQIVAEIRDPHCPWNTGRFRLQANDDGRLRVTPTTDAAECDLDIIALAALIYGVVAPEMFVPRGWGNVSPAAQATLATLFPPLSPFVMVEF